jgi:hypothetical protein
MHMVDLLVQVCSHEYQCMRISLEYLSCNDQNYRVYVQSSEVFAQRNHFIGCREQLQGM